MPFIQNCAASDISSGTFYLDPGENSMLIQIGDPGSWFPEPRIKFVIREKFEFLDIEEDDEVYDEECRISDEQAMRIAHLLKTALSNDMNVIVHCYAGVCRSGAVAEVGIMMGFDDTATYRSPNLLVKHKLMKAIGLKYDPSEWAVELE